MTGKRLDGRIALITGASRGIGAAIAKRYSAEGAQIVLTARTTGGLEEVDDAIRQAGGDGVLCIATWIAPSMPCSSIKLSTMERGSLVISIAC